MKDDVIACTTSSTSASEIIFLHAVQAHPGHVAVQQFRDLNGNREHIFSHSSPCDSAALTRSSAPPAPAQPVRATGRHRWAAVCAPAAAHDLFRATFPQDPPPAPFIMQPPPSAIFSPGCVGRTGRPRGQRSTFHAAVPRLRARRARRRSDAPAGPRNRVFPSRQHKTVRERFWRANQGFKSHRRLALQIPVLRKTEQRGAGVEQATEAGGLRMVRAEHFRGDPSLRNGAEEVAGLVHPAERGKSGNTHAKRLARRAVAAPQRQRRQESQDVKNRRDRRSLKTRRPRLAPSSPRPFRRAPRQRFPFRHVRRRWPRYAPRDAGNAAPVRKNLPRNGWRDNPDAGRRRPPPVRRRAGFSDARRSLRKNERFRRRRDRRCAGRQTLPGRVSK